MMLIRESKLIEVVIGMLAIWSWIFATDLAGRADSVSSRQWQYLLSIPGHQWSWAGLFMAAATLTTVGLIIDKCRYAVRAAGLALMGFGAFSIGLFYIAAPLIDPGLTTLGYHPWFGFGSAMLLVAVVNWKPVAWF